VGAADSTEIRDSQASSLGEAESGCLKKSIIAEIEKLYNYYKTAGDKGRTIAYAKAIRVIKLHDKPIKTGEELDGIPGIGDGISRKIKEFIADGTIKKFAFIESDPKHKILTELGNVWGLGPKGSQKLYDKGIRSVDDLRKKPELLTTMQKVGLKYYEDFMKKIPRAEVEQLLARVKAACQTLYKNIQAEACGSFRRGRLECGDIDVLITRTDGSSIKGVTQKVVEKLEEEGFLKERLGDFRYSTTGSEGYMGVCQLTDKHLFRRIDIKAYPQTQYGFALLYFTGSGPFNLKMREKALELGYSLSDHGLKPTMPGNPSFDCPTEQDIFKALKMPYRTPQERDI
jgi:DNA polymerase lambda